MELTMHHTFSRNLTYSNITKLGKYSNIRFFMKEAIYPSSPMFVYPLNIAKGPSPNHNKGQYQWHTSDEVGYLDAMAAPKFKNNCILTGRAMATGFVRPVLCTPYLV